MEITSVKKLKFLLNLYNYDEITNRDLLNMNLSSSAMFKIKRELLDEGVLEETERLALNPNGMRPLQLIKINHKVLDQILLREKFTKILFDRTLANPYTKPRKLNIKMIKFKKYL